MNAEKISREIGDDVVETWEYNDQAPPGAPPGRHVGPYAEDVGRKYGIGDGKMLLHQDMIGLEMAASKGHSQRIEKLERRLSKIEKNYRRKKAHRRNS